MCSCSEGVPGVRRVCDDSSNLRGRAAAFGIDRDSLDLDFPPGRDSNYCNTLTYELVLQFVHVR